MCARIRHINGLEKYMRRYLMARIPDTEVDRLKREIALVRLV